MPPCLHRRPSLSSAPPGLWGPSPARPRAKPGRAGARSSRAPASFLRRLAHRSIADNRSGSHTAHHRPPPDDLAGSSRRIPAVCRPARRLASPFTATRSHRHRRSSTPATAQSSPSAAGARLRRLPQPPSHAPLLIRLLRPRVRRTAADPVNLRPSSPRLGFRALARGSSEPSPAGSMEDGSDPPRPAIQTASLVPDVLIPLRLVPR